MLYRLKYKGCAICSEIGYNSRTKKELFNYFLNSLDFDSFGYKKINKLSTNKIKRLIDEAGFEIVRIKEIKLTKGQVLKYLVAVKGHSEEEARKIFALYPLSEYLSKDEQKECAEFNK